MTLETFFDKFDQFADAPDAVAKMRELVLDWAVSGKLFHDDSIEWNDGILESVIELISGQHLLANEHNTEGKGIPYLTGPSDFGKKSPVPTRWTEHPKVTAEPGDILITVKGSGVGKLNIIVDQTTAISRQLMAVRVTDADSDFVYLVLRRAAEHFQNAKTGIAIPGIGRKDVLNLKTLLPPLAEQKRIVAKVDELMALCDRLEAQQQERDTRHAALARASLARFADAPTPANLHHLFHPSYTIPPADLRKSILTLAVQGKLVPQDPNDEPAEDVVKVIAQDRAAAIKGKQMRKPKAIDPYENELPFDLPSTWIWSQLGLLVAAEDNAMCDGPFGSKLKTAHYIDQEGFAVIRLGNIGVGNFIWGKEGHIPETHFKSLAGNHTKQGDLIVAGMAEPLIRCCETPPNLGPAINKADCFRVRLHQKMDRTYIRHFLNSPVAKSLAAEENHGMTRQRINLGNAKALPVPIPPLAEQRRIVAKVDQLMALVDELETQLAASRATAKNLLQALVDDLTK